MSHTTETAALSPGSRRWVRGILLLFGVMGAMAGIYLLATIPPTEDSFYPRCQLHSLTGLHCPGCGTTRALHALFNGRVAQALAYNPLAFIVPPLLAWSFMKSVGNWYRQTPWCRTRNGSRYLHWVLLAALLTYAVLRNLPIHPFNLLAPHEL